MRITSQDYKQRILRDMSTSNWLRNEIESLDSRDVCDASSDVEVLSEFLSMKYDEMLTANNKPQGGE